MAADARGRAGPLVVAIIVYACEVDAPDHHTLYEECYTVIRASSTADAIAWAEAHAHRPLPRTPTDDPAVCAT